MLDHERAQANVTRIQSDLANRRLPRRERRERETELVQWRFRLAGSTQTIDDLRTPELERIDRAEAKVTPRRAGLYDRQRQRAHWFASHPEAARRLDRIDREIQALDVIVEGPARATELERGQTRNRPWTQVPVAARSLDVGIGL